MLQRLLSENIAKALEHAEAAERRASDVTDPELRSDNERLAQSWRLVASSFQFVESLEQVVTDPQRQRNAFERLEEFLQRRNLPPPEPDPAVMVGVLAPLAPNDVKQRLCVFDPEPQVSPECARPDVADFCRAADEPGFEKRTFECPRCSEVDVRCNYNEESEP